MRLLVVLGLFALASAEYKTYEGYKVLEVVPTTEYQLEWLHKWSLEEELDFWLEPRSLDRPVHIMFSPEQIEKGKLVLRNLDLVWREIHDVGEEIAAEMLNNPVREPHVPGRNVPYIESWLNYDGLMGVMDEVMAECAANEDLVCNRYTAGQSYQGRDMDVISVHSTRYTPGGPAHWVDGLIHAREWLVGPTVLNMLIHLVNDYEPTGDHDLAVRDMLDHYEFFFLPIMNPDGYEYTHTNERLWRKNRTPNSGSPCIGTDLNRNYDFNWGLQGVSHAPCSDLYCGSEGNSEPETQVVAAESARLGDRLWGWITVHSYGYMWMFPPGNREDFNDNAPCARLPDHDDMMEVADKAADEIQNTCNERTWDRGTSCEVIYETTGATDDYVKGVDNVKYPICPELRGNGFIVSTDLIMPSTWEIFNGFKHMVDMIAMVETDPDLDRIQGWDKDCNGNLIPGP